MGSTYRAPNGRYPYYPDSGCSSYFTIADMETYIVEDKVNPKEIPTATVTCKNEPTSAPTSLPTSSRGGSTTLSNNAFSWVESQLPPTTHLGTMCYRMSTDGASLPTFYEKCAGKGPSVTVVKTTKGHVFGAYRGS